MWQVRRTYRVSGDGLADVCADAKTEGAVRVEHAGIVA
jgi:hypothetical protein